MGGPTLHMTEHGSITPTKINNVARHNKGGVYSIFIFVVFLFLLSTLFDPADRALGLKLPLYVACWGIGLLMYMGRQDPIKISIGLFIYTFLMTLIPIASVGYYLAMDGSEPFEGFLLLKSYLFISFAILIYFTRINVLKYLSIALSILAIQILLLTAVVLIYPETHIPIYTFGEHYGIFSIDAGRDYGSGLKLFQMYFVTSSMLVIPIAYYFDLAKTSKQNIGFHWALVLLSICAMFVAGTRNNMIMAIVLPVTLFVMYSKYRLGMTILMAAATGLFIFAWHDEIAILFDPTEASNYVKLSMLEDYAVIFSDPNNLLFGRGLGSYEYWTGRGYKFVTELTYLEIIRNFGLLLGGLMILLLLYPIVYAFVIRRSYKKKNIVLAYAVYLIMSISNPLLFSSMGMLILGMIIADIFIHDTDMRRRRLLQRISARSTAPSPTFAIPNKGFKALH